MPKHLEPLSLVFAGCVLVSSCERQAAESEPQPVAQAAPQVEGRSLLGQELTRITPTGERLAHYESELAAARARWESTGTELDAIWVGRHLAYLGRYGEAIDWFTARLGDFPGSVRLMRHRGHRHISLRQWNKATDDFERAWDRAQLEEDAVEPDGAPNEQGIPRSTTHTNVLYHLALSFYVQGDFHLAAAYWNECALRSPNDDMRVAAWNWQVHALRRAGKQDEAKKVLEQVQPEMDVIENHAYHRILLLQKGELTEEEVLDVEGDGVQNATAAYGVANWAFCNGDEARARELWQRIVDETPWNAFGHICAEAELAR